MPKKMRFTEDKQYRDITYLKGQVYDIPDELVDRWIKRGGEIVGDIPVQSKEVVEQAPETIKNEIEPAPPKRGPGRPKKSK